MRKVSDTVPSEGTLARQLYDLLLASPYLAPITQNPGMFAVALVTEHAERVPAVRLRDEMRRANHYLATTTVPYKDGRAFLRNWFRRVEESILSEKR